MKLSKETVNVLKSFTNVNPSIVVNDGNVLSTMSNSSNVLATATVPEVFPSKFGIYDLGVFLNTLSLFDDPELDIEDQFVSISDASGSSSKYYFADPSIIKHPPKDSLDCTDKRLSFTLDKVKLSQILKAASVISVNVVNITNEDGDIMMSACDPKNNKSHSYSVSVGTCDKDATFDLYLETETLRLVNGDYDVDVFKFNDIPVSVFTNTSVVVKYYIALGAKSSID